MSNWLDQALEYLSHLPQGVSRDKLWRSFLLWSAYQVSEPRQPDAQAEILSPYGNDVRTLFRGAFRAVGLGIAENQHQNALLRLGVAFGTAYKYSYNEKAAERTFLHEVVGPVLGHSYEKALSKLDVAVFRGNDCEDDYGSELIASANVVRQKFPDSYQERSIFVALGSDQSCGHLAAFIQLSIMGMPCYAAVDEFVMTADQMPLFAPASAFCSPEFFSEYWNWMRWQRVRNLGWQL